MSATADFRLAVRYLRGSPGYAAIAVLTFALAIGANSAIFSAVHAVLLRPLPVEAPGDLAVIWQTDDEGGQAVIELTYRHLREWIESGTILARAAVMGSHNWSAVLESRGEPSRVWFCGVSAGYFDTLGVAPLHGRALVPEDDVPNAAPVAVLNHGTWVRRFGADPTVVGTTMTLDGDSVEIVGVMPPGIEFPRGAEFWVPVVPILASSPSGMKTLDAVGVFYIIARMRPGLAMSTLHAEVNALEARLDAADPGRLKWGSRAVVTPFVDFVFGPVRPALRVLWAAVGVLLLIACANVSGLMLTRVSRRRHEHAIRLALGATRTAIGRLWAFEVLLLAVAGGALGLIVAHWMAAAIVALTPDDLPRAGEIGVNGTVALFTFVAVLAVALATGAMPLRSAGASSLVPTIEGERSTTSRHSLRARSTLLVVQIGLAVILLVAAGLVVRSFLALREVDLGFQPARVLTLTVEPRDSPRPANEWLDDFLARVRALPGVHSAGAVFLRPLMLGPIGQNVRIYLEGQPQTPEAAQANPTVNHQIATPGYFETMQIPLRAGRYFTHQDTARTPRVAIVSESTARRLWPGRDPIGLRLLTASVVAGEPPLSWRTVVGVVSDVRYRGLHEVQLDLYDPALQVDRRADNVVVRTVVDPLLLVEPIRRLARDLDARALVDNVTTMDAVVGRAQAPWRLTMWMFVLFAILAFGLSALGLFSLVALDVAHRGREFAIRLALGASRGAIVGGVLARAGRRVLAGLTAGIAASFAAGRAMGHLLFGIAPADGLTYAVVLVAVLVVVALAAYVPARRAARAEPQTLLRQG